MLCGVNILLFVGRVVKLTVCSPAVLVTYAKIEDTVLEAGVQADLAELGILVLKVGFGTGGILQIERKTALSLAGDEQLADRDLYILNSAALDRFQRLCNGTLDQHNRL